MARKLLETVREVLRLHHYSYRTEQTYVQWIRRFILYNDKRHPRELGAREIQHFLTTLATRGKVAASTQNQALSAILFLYRKVLQVDLPRMDDIVRAKRPVRVPIVLTQVEVGSDALARVVTVVFTYRVRSIRLISARRASRKERKAYERRIRSL